MSVRQDNENKNCPSRGLGIAAAAIGVGVGAALYYFFSKREDPDASGATSSWRCEREHALPFSSPSSSFTTISEHSTTDTSMNTSNSSDNDSYETFNETSDNETSSNESDDSTSSIESSNSDDNYEPADDSDDFGTGFESFEETQSFIESSLLTDTSFETGYLTLHLNSSSFRDNSTSVTRNSSIESDSDWNVTTSSLDVPHHTTRHSTRGVRRIIDIVINLTSPRVQTRRAEDEQMAILREEAFRQRSWGPEECSICFDMMTQTQEVMSLPCTHRFHQGCILPWLQEKQTCPNCRKTA